MPIYEYLCQACAYTFELKQSIKADPIATCERCGQAVNRIISSPAIMFKGSGWYVTDYSDKLKPPAGESPAAPASPSNDAAAPAAAAAAQPATPSVSAPSGSASSTPSTTPSRPSSSSGSTPAST